MKLRVLRQDHTVIAIVAMVFALGLVAINAVWPDAFAVVIAIGGVVGALVVLYEVRLTKRIAQAEFVRELQSGFAADPNICALWSKLLLGEDVTSADRPLVSSYLTFFETLHLLLARGSLEFTLTDDLFRNRFFTAVGDKGVQDTALIEQAGAFANIHKLVDNWHRHMLDRKIPVHEGYYSYVRGITEAKGYQVAPMGIEDLPALLALQEEVLASLTEPAWLRANSEGMLADCLTDHVTLGVRSADGVLVAAAVLYDARATDESIKKYFTADTSALEGSINLKLVLALPSHRRSGLGRTLVELLEREATRRGKGEIMCTIHPRNVPSQSLFKLLGYRCVGRVQTKYGKRLVFGRELQTVNRQWAR